MGTSARLSNRLRSDERGIAMVVVLGVLLVASILIAVMFETVLREQTATGRERNITNGRQAAEAGIDKMVYELGQGSNWDGYTTTYPSGCTNNCYAGTVGGSSYSGSVRVDPTNSQYRIITMRGQFPANRPGDQRVLQVRVSKIPPPALSYAMFASRGIDIHHHASSWLSPQVATTSVHSNGYMKMDYSAEFVLQNLEVVGLLQFQNGGGQSPGGAIPTTGYQWFDPLNRLCYPGNFPGSTVGVQPVGGVYPNMTCPAANRYSGNASITGNIFAGSVKMGTRGIVKQDLTDPVLQTGLHLGSRNGDILAGRFQGPTGNPLQTPGDYCVNGLSCLGANAINGGQVAGKITIQSGYAPPVIPFPVLQYPQFRSSATAHVYASCAAFITAMTTNAGGAFYKNISPANGTLVNYTSGMPDVIVASGNNYIDSGSCDFEWDDIRAKVAAAACNSSGQHNCAGNGVPAATASAPMIIIQGSLVVPNGGITAQAPMVVIGADESPDGIVVPPDGTTTPATPQSVNETQLLATGTKPGVLAAGGSITTHDFDSDSKWLSTSAYEWWKASPIYVRGLVYSATYVDTKTATPQNQHFHNDDPKNFIKVFGSQIGAVLHNCMNFTFTYDPIVENTPFVTSPGTVKIVDYQEMRPSQTL